VPSRSPPARPPQRSAWNADDDGDDDDYDDDDYGDDRHGGSAKPKKLSKWTAKSIVREYGSLITREQMWALEAALTDEDRRVRSSASCDVRQM
jgi:hypothetical protein